MKGKKEQISFRKLLLQIMPEVWVIQLVGNISLGIGTSLTRRLADVLLHTRAAAFTSANLGSLLFSWQGIILILLGLAVVLVFVTIEFFAVIILIDDILKGRQQKVFREVFSAIGRAFAALPRFFRPGGLLILLYLVVVLPLVGIRFLMTFNRPFRIPNFIMEVIEANTVFAILYWVMIVALFVIGILFAFSVYGVLNDKMKPLEAAKNSLRLIKKNLKAYLLGLLKLFVIMGLIGAGSWLIFRFLPDEVVRLMGEEKLKAAMQPQNYYLVLALAVLGGILLYNLTETLLVSYFLLRYSCFYDDFSKGQVRKSFEPRTMRGKNTPFIISLILVGVVWFGSAYLISRNFFSDPPAADISRIIAHRTGGDLASENSVEGIEQAYIHGCEGSETDIRRTADGRYVISHDNTFKRLTGVNRKPEEMSTEEISELRIRDTTGSGQLLHVPMLEDLLDESTGKVRLYIELKGSTADHQMVDDVIKLLKEKYRDSDVALISLNYNVIEYTETHYPEYLTGVLMFQGYGNLADMDCDMIMMEEDMLTDDRIEEIHKAGKQAAAWTVNTSDGLWKAYAIGVDAVITDQVERANYIKDEFRNRSDMEILEDFLQYQIGFE